MTLITVLENEYATLRYEDTDHYIYHTWHKPISGEHLRHVTNTGTDLIREKKITKWLSDDRKNAELPMDDILYAIQDWGPRTAAAGWKYWALVVPEDIAGRASMQDLVNTYFELGVRVAVFTDLEAARTWLLNR